MTARTTASVHDVTAADISVSIGYAEGQQSHLQIAGVTVFFDSASTPTEQGLAALRRLRAETQRLEMYLQAKVEQERPKPIGGGFCPCTLGWATFYSDEDRDHWQEQHDCCSHADALSAAADDLALERAL